MEWLDRLHEGLARILQRIELFNAGVPEKVSAQVGLEEFLEEIGRQTGA